jgi:hypothetical protein
MEKPEQCARHIDDFVQRKIAVASGYPLAGCVALS